MAAPQQGRHVDLIRRLFSLKEPLNPSILEDFFPSIELTADVPELYRLRGERLYTGAGRGVSAVAVVGRVWLMNKKANTLVIVRRIVVTAQTAQGISINMTTIGLPLDGAGGQSNLEGSDSRDGTGTPGTTPGGDPSVANDTIGAGITVGAIRAFTGTGPLFLDTWYVLQPNYALTVTGDAAGANNDIMVSFIGYSRTVEPSELAQR